MLKTLIFLLISLSIACTAMAQKPDTTIVYLKSIGGLPVHVESLEDADYYRIVVQVTPTDKSYDVKEFYKSGKIKFIGKTYGGGAFSLRPTSDIQQYDGQCISYFESGKKASTSNYVNGKKDGMEYFFYPTGKVHCVIKHGRSLSFEGLKWECYDEQGNVLCKDGDGKWIIYNESYTNITLHGQVIDGLMDGEWDAVDIELKDTIKIVYQYRNNLIHSSVGYDRKGNVYPFKQPVTPAFYKNGNISFVEELRNRIKLPRDANGKKMSIDTLHLFFVVEKDGQLSGFRIYGEVEPKLQDAVFAGLAKVSGWTARKIYGIPFRAELVFPLNGVTGHTEGRWISRVEWGERILNDN